MPSPRTYGVSSGSAELHPAQCRWRVQQLPEGRDGRGGERMKIGEQAKQATRVRPAGISVICNRHFLSNSRSVFSNFL